MTVEFLNSTAPELRFAPDDTGVITGYAAVWGKPDSFGDVLVRGCFAASLEQHRANGTRPLMLWAHNPADPVGTWTSFVEDDVGLKVEGRLCLDATRGRDTFELIRAGCIDGLSQGFLTKKATALPKGGRRVEAVELIEVSLVARPAQGAARVTSIRSQSHAAGLAAHIRNAAENLKKG